MTMPWVGEKSSDSSISCCMDYRLARSWSRCPFAVGSKFVIALLKLMSAMPGQERKCLCLMACWKVEREGLKAHLWKYSARLCLVMSFCMITFGCCAHGSWKWTSHNLSIQMRVPRRITLRFLYTLRACLSQTAMQSLSHSCPMDKRDALSRPLRTCP